MLLRQAQERVWKSRGQLWISTGKGSNASKDAPRRIAMKIRRLTRKSGDTVVSVWLPQWVFSHRP
jgi:hypothetical protein